MSEHQYIAFRAIDRPVSKENLEYMRKQSSRAEITPWSFENEYHFGDFRGDALEMLRRGYDLHLHWANFGIRKVLIRFPHGLPNASAVKPYLGEDSLSFLKDKQGPGGALCIQPYHEPGDFDDYCDFTGILDLLGPLRAEILDGDLRPLYLANLVMAFDNNHKLVKQRSRDAYQQIAQLLADLREALAGSDQSKLAEKQSQKLRKENPTLGILVSELRRKGLPAK